MKCTPSPITVANEKVSIVAVLKMLDVELPDDVVRGRSWKVHCPFGPLYHSDGGVAEAMRVYPETNSAYCFSCSQYYSPVLLASKAFDTTGRVAAERLLEHFGIAAQEQQSWEQARCFEQPPDKALMADALKTYCRRISPDWSSQQFDRDVAATLSRCFALLNLVKTDADVTMWLSRCKDVMREVLHMDASGSRENDAVSSSGMRAGGGEADR